jgi:2-methylcitrate synthase
VANGCEFEEIAHLLVHGKLPTRRTGRLQGQAEALRGIPASVKPRWSNCRRRRTRWT